MTDNASNRLARAAGRDQFFSFGDAACRNVSDKSGVRIAALCSVRVLRQFDNPIANRFVSAIRQWHAHEVLIDEGLRNTIGLDNCLPNFWFQARKPLAGLPGVLIG